MEMFRTRLKLRREERALQLWGLSPCDGNELWDWPKWLRESVEQAEGKTERPTYRVKRRSGLRQAGEDPRETHVTEAKRRISRSKECFLLL